MELHNQFQFCIYFAPAVLVWCMYMTVIAYDRPIYWRETEQYCFEMQMTANA